MYWKASNDFKQFQFEILCGDFCKIVDDVPSRSWMNDGTLCIRDLDI